MELICESNDLNEYLTELNAVDYSNSVLQEKISELFNASKTDIEKAKIAFEFVRDEIHHSWYIQDQQVTCNESEVLAALLRSEGIPTGFCYQRLMLFDTPEKGYCIHALNAVFLKSIDKWIRLDTRGNKPGIDAQFSTDEEKLAFTIQEKLDEKDYPIIYIEPHHKTISTLKNHTNALEMYKYHLPESL